MLPALSSKPKQGVRQVQGLTDDSIDSYANMSQSTATFADNTTSRSSGGTTARGHKKTLANATDEDGAALARVVRDRKASGDEELTLHVGDVVKVLSTKRTGYLKCEFNDEVGYVPSSYLEFFDEPSTAAADTAGDGDALDTARAEKRKKKKTKKKEAASDADEPTTSARSPRKAHGERRAHRVDEDGDAGGGGGGEGEGGGRGGEERSPRKKKKKHREGAKKSHRKHDDDEEEEADDDEKGGYGNAGEDTARSSKRSSRKSAKAKKTKRHSDSDASSDSDAYASPSRHRRHRRHRHRRRGRDSDSDSDSDSASSTGSSGGDSSSRRRRRQRGHHAHSSSDEPDSDGDKRRSRRRHKHRGSGSEGEAATTRSPRRTKRDDEPKTARDKGDGKLTAREETKAAATTTTASATTTGATTATTTTSSSKDSGTASTKSTARGGKDDDKKAADAHTKGLGKQLGDKMRSLLGGGKKSERTGKSSSGILNACPNTVQGEEGWYEHGENERYYFVLVDGKWSLLYGPMTEEDFEIYCQKVMEQNRLVELPATYLHKSSYFLTTELRVQKGSS